MKGRVAAVIAGILVVWMNRSSLSQPAPDPALGRANGNAAWPGLSTTPYLFFIPAPISADEFRRFKAILHLSDAQVQFADYLYSQYQDRCKDLDHEWSPKLIAAADPLIHRVQAGDHSQSAAKNDELQTVYKQESEFDEALQREDDLLIAKLEVALDKTQKPWLPRVKLHRERTRSWTRFFMLPKTRIDLSLMADRWALPPEAIEKVDSTLWEYEQAVTPAIVAAYKKRRDSRSQTAELEREQQFDAQGNPLDLNDPSVQAQNKILRDRTAELQQDRAHAELEVGRINDKYLPRIVERLPVDVGGAFKLSYLSMAYMRVYPDPSDPQALFGQIMKRPEINDDLRQALSAKWKSYRDGYEKICDQLQDETDRWLEQLAARGGMTGWQDHEARLENWLQQRLTANERFVSQLRAILPAEVLSSSDRDFGMWSMALEAYQRSPRSHAQDYPSAN